MKLLLDTHAFLWFVSGDHRLSTRARQAMQRQDAELLLSAVSVWEMAIKLSLGRLMLPTSLEAYLKDKVEDGFGILPLEWPHAAAVEKLPFHHRDPFDRLLVAQSMLEGVPLVSGDRAFSAYKIRMIW